MTFNGNEKKWGFPGENRGRASRQVGKYVLSPEAQESSALSKNWTQTTGETSELQREPCGLHTARDRSIGAQSHIEGLELGSQEVQWEAIRGFQAEKWGDHTYVFQRSCWQLSREWVRQEMEPGRPTSDFCQSPGENRWWSELRWWPLSWTGPDLFAGRIHRVWWWIRCSQEREKQEWVRIPGLNCYRVEQSVLRRNLEGGVWGREMRRWVCNMLCLQSFETLKKAVRCLGMTVSWGICPEQEIEEFSKNVSKMPWGWFSCLTTKPFWPIFTAGLV